MSKISSLCFLVRGDSILLGMKKRGFGEGKWNGVGGKVATGETIEAATLRELYEEVGVRGDEKDLISVAVLRFRSGSAELNWDVHVFFLYRWLGEPAESEEMRPAWHEKGSLPFELMWPDDQHWFPHVLSGRRIEGFFRFDEAGKDILEYTIKDL